MLHKTQSREYESVLQALIIPAAWMSSIESIKTTSIGTVSTGVRDINKEHYLRSKDKAEKWYIKTYTIAYVKIQKNEDILSIMSPTARLFKSRFQKDGPTCRRQVVDPRHQTPQGPSVAKPETLLQNIHVELLDVTERGPMALCWIRYSERRSRGKNILGGERLQNNGRHNISYPNVYSWILMCLLLLSVFAYDYRLNIQIYLHIFLCLCIYIVIIWVWLVNEAVQRGSLDPFFIQ